MDLQAHAKRAEKAWSDKAPFESLYREAFDWAIPYRRVAIGQAERRVERLFDATATASALRGAGQLKEDLFPSGRPWFKLKRGPMAKRLARQGMIAGHNGGPPLDDDPLTWRKIFASFTDQIAPYFATGEFDQAATEMAIDLFAGTGVMLVLEGDRQNPVLFVTLPLEECALGQDGYNRVNLLSWRREWKLRDLKDAFPKATFPPTIAEKLAKIHDCGDEAFTLVQDFVREGQGWRHVAYLKGHEASSPPLATGTFRKQPFIAPRYHRVPGEVFGRGPLLQALPTVKTLNKVQELTLKAAAIQLLGIWGYRPGGAFNPNIHRLAPGAFWPVNSAGGVMGPDVARLDPASGRLDVSNIVTQELRGQISTLLHDERLPEKGATPISASEVVARMQRVKQNYIGAWGRLIQETQPLIPRVAEILFDKGLLELDITPDQFFLAVENTSPLALALKVDQLDRLIQYIQIVAGLGRDPKRNLDMDAAEAWLEEELDLPADMLRTAAQRAEFDQAQAAAMAAQQMAQAVLDDPKGVAEAAAIATGQNVVPMRGAA